MNYDVGVFTRRRIISPAESYFAVPPPAGGGGANVSVNATGTYAHPAGSTSFSYTGLTVAAGTNTAIVVAISWDDVATSTTSISAMTWGSQALTQIVRRDTAAPTTVVEIWGLAGEHGAVATGTQTLALTLTTTRRPFIVAMAFDNVNQTGGATSFPNSTSNAGAFATLAVTSAVGNMVMNVADSSAAATGVTGTTIFNDSTTGVQVNAYANYDVGAATVNIGQVPANNIFAVATDILKA